MTLDALILLILQSSIVALDFSVGLQTELTDLAHLLRRPARLIRALTAMNLVMPALAVTAVLVLPMRDPVKVALVALSLSPVPPLLPPKMLKVGARHDYAVALLFSASVFAIVWIPLAAHALDWIFPSDIRIPAAATAKLVSMTVLVPTLAGAVAARLSPSLAQRAAGPLARCATVLLISAFALTLARTAPAMLALVGDGTLLMIVGFLVLGLLTGHLLGGPDPAGRSALALATASRHPGIALGIAHLTFPGETAVVAALFLYLVVGAVVTRPYVRWRRTAAAQGATKVADA